MDIDAKDTALVITDPQNDFLSPSGGGDQLRLSRRIGHHHPRRGGRTPILARRLITLRRPGW